MNENENLLPSQTANSTVTGSIKRSTMIAEHSYDFKKLGISHPSFMPCIYEVQGEDVILTFDMTGMTQSSFLVEEDIVNKYQFLINLGHLKELMSDYNFEMTPENIYYDDNFMPVVKLRDIYEPGRHFDEEKFLVDYKCFVGGILHKKYSVADVRDCGFEILKKDKYLYEICLCDNLADILKGLRNKRQEIISYRNTQEIRVNKASYHRRLIIGVTAIVVLMGAVGYTGYHTLITEPVKEAVIKGNQAFINRDYVGCVDALAGLDLEQMDADTKYILAVSYSQGETFKKDEIQTILAKLSPTSDIKSLDYWIHIGRLELAEAQDIAISLSDDKLLIYAYMKEAALVESDTSLTGEEKRSRLSNLENNIKTLSDKYADVEEKDLYPEDNVTTNTNISEETAEETNTTEETGD